MYNEHIVGPFTVEITGPYPVWITITYNDKQIYHIRHTELRDLEYAIQRAIKDTRDALPETYKCELD